MRPRWGSFKAPNSGWFRNDHNIHSHMQCMQICQPWKNNIWELCRFVIWYGLLVIMQGNSELNLNSIMCIRNLMNPFKNLNYCFKGFSRCCNVKSHLISGVCYSEWSHIQFSLIYFWRSMLRFQLSLLKQLGTPRQN